jgi:ankyrin repeat protein
MSGTQQLLDELFALSQSETCESLFSVDCLREIIERYGCERNSNINVEDYRFFLEFCGNGSVTEGMLRYLLEYFPGAVNATSRTGGLTPLHMVCYNKNATRGMVQLLIDACPESIGRGDNDGWKPLHFLCINNEIDDTAAVDILGFFLERCPEAAQRAAGNGLLPIHLACGLGKSPEFCRMLIEAYPGSERITAPDGLPLHFACWRNDNVAVAEYLYNLYPEGINVAAGNGLYPIHYAIEGLTVRDNPKTAIDMVQFLLHCDPDTVLQEYEGNLPLHWVCKILDVFESRLARIIGGARQLAWVQKENAAIKITQILYDARPEAIVEDGDIARDIRTFPDEIQTFINTQLNLARLARNSTVRQMKKRDENGQVPLHGALRDNVTLGSIKLLVKRNPSVILTPDNSGALPLHVACQHNDSPKVVDYLIGLDPNTLTAVDREGNTALHLACRGAKYDTISLLLKKYDAVAVSKRNALNRLPVHLLFESDAISNREDDTKYLESVFQLLRANPETVMLPGDEKQQSTRNGGRPSRSGKKRKYCA